MEIVLALVIVTASVFAMASGYIFAGKKIKGSCGGLAIKTKNDVVECQVCGKKGDEIATCDTPKP